MARLVLWDPQWLRIGRLVPFLRRCWARAELRVVQVLGLHQPWDPALAIQAPVTVPELALGDTEMDEAPSFLDSIFWMAAPKSRRSIEVNRCRRRNPNKLIKVKYNIDVCPECGHLKQKHVLCGFCYEKVRLETAKIRGQIKAQEGGPFQVATVETLVLYEGEKPSEGDQGRRIIERPRKRPSWFTLHSGENTAAQTES
ncbi:39S ribosomal protein L32, mitochondrial-like [Microcaecilia unicolor]|uniref:Large ribosomal subunit protein bL32m n=1 Tax=Microcaecilia unicolor TaxID=1415580 RepID=A0A6P7X3I1_9AMPH|nr:39S ribosomal protein L32, mitochondrial-like [Microcaecilia unicolor]